jgi:hypothetical protein
MTVSILKNVFHSRRKRKLLKHMRLIRYCFGMPIAPAGCSDFIKFPWGVGFGVDTSLQAINVIDRRNRFTE